MKPFIAAAVIALGILAYATGAFEWFAEHLDQSFADNLGWLFRDETWQESPPSIEPDEAEPDEAVSE